jgi:hypothetical protein
MTMKLGKDTGSLMNHVLSQMRIEPVLGGPCTILSWTDRHAATVIEVKKNFVRVQHDHARRTDSNGMSESQEYEYSRNPNGQVDCFRRVTRGKNKGVWVECDQTGRAGPSTRNATFGARRKYYDFSF